LEEHAVLDKMGENKGLKIEWKSEGKIKMLEKYSEGDIGIKLPNL
jgi:hypothetical protein